MQRTSDPLVRGPAGEALQLQLAALQQLGSNAGVQELVTAIMSEHRHSLQQQRVLLQRLVETQKALRGLQAERDHAQAAADNRCVGHA